MEPNELAQSICSFLEYLSKAKRYSPHTIRAYRGDLLLLEKASQRSGHKKRSWEGSFEEGLKVHLRLFLEGLGDFELKTRSRRLATLRAYLGWLLEGGKIQNDLRFYVPSVRSHEKLPHFLSLDEVITLLRGFELEKRRHERAPTDEKSIYRLARDRLLILLLYGGGLRISEACNLSWSCVTGDGHLRVLGKGGKERLVVLPPIVLTALQSFPRVGSFLFGSRPMNSRTGYEIVRVWGRRVGLVAPLHPHALRHSYATHLLADGANLRIVQELLGHSSLSSTERYTHLTVDHLAQTMERHHPLGEKGVRDGSKSHIPRSRRHPDRG